MSLSSSIKIFFLARRTILVLFGLVLLSIIAGSLFPQRFNTLSGIMDQWQADYPILAKLSSFLGLDHVYTSPWFAIFLALFFLSLCFSSLEQVRLAVRRTFGESGKGSGKEHCVIIKSDAVVAALRSNGYRGAGERRGRQRFVKNVLGHWGAAFLHIGILLVIVASLYIILTRQKGMIVVAETETFAPGATWGSEEKGLLAGRFYLADALQVDSVQPQFWEDDKLRQLRTGISFLQPNGKKLSRELEINSPVHYNGVRVKLTQNFGRTFLLALVDGAGQELFLRLDMNHPLERDKASYKDFDFDTLPFSIKAKYYADANKTNLAGDNPLLGLRLVRGEQVVSELYLEKDQAGQLGPYEVKLAGVKWWVALDCANVRGVWLVYLGFFIIILGVGLTYFLVPQEIFLSVREDGCFISRSRSRFDELYESEMQDIISHG